MTQSCCNYIISLLPITLFLVMINCILAKIHQSALTDNLSSNKYNYDKGHEIHDNLRNQLFCEEYDKYVFDCYLPSRTDIIVKFILNNDNGMKSSWMKEVQFFCFNENPLNISLPLLNDFPKKADYVIFNSCRFIESTDIKNLLKNSLKLSDIKGIFFKNKHTDSFLSRESLEKLDSFIDNLSFDIQNISTLPPDLFFGMKKIRKLSISSALSVNLTQLHSLLAPLENLEDMLINTTNLIEVHGRNFAHQKKLTSLSLHNINISSLPSDIFSNLTNLKNITFNETCFTKLPRNLFNKTRDIQEFRLIQSQIALNALPTLHNLTHLKIVMINCQMETIPANIFSSSKNIISIDLKRNNLSEIPLEQFSDQKELLYLDLSENKIRTFDVGLLKYNLKLKHLDLSDNRILRFPVNIRLRNLVSLQLARNFSFNLNSNSNQDKLVNQTLNSNCSYEIRLDDKFLILNCSKGNNIPSPFTFNLPGIELYLNNITLKQMQSSQLLLNNEQIVVFSLFNSTITELPQSFLTNLTILKKVILDLPLEKISSDIFFNSMKIENIKISGTHIEQLPEFIFSNQTNLTDLDLSKNKLTEIANYAFKSNKYLRRLRLSYNYLKTLSPLMFYNLLQLREIYLDNNRLCHVNSNAFAYTRSLKIIDMNHNQLERTEPLSIAVKTLEKLMLRNNSIGNSNFRGIQQLSSPTITIDLSLNNITSLDQWDLSSIQFESTNSIFTQNSVWMIKVLNKQSLKRNWIVFGNNSLYCDCNSMVLKQESNQSSIFKNLQCLFLDELKKGHPVRGLPLDELLCPMDNSTCPDKCRCFIRPFNLTLIVNCSRPDVKLLKVPKLPKIEMAFQNGIELYIANNQLTSLKHRKSGSGYNRITKLVAANNSITNISIRDIPENLTFLDLSSNQLQELDPEVLSVLEESQTLKFISLIQNQWICDCSSKNLVQFILKTTPNSDMDKCLDGTLLRELNHSAICSNDQNDADDNTLIEVVTKIVGHGVIAIIVGIIIIIIIMITTFISCLPCLLPILYYKNKESILIWMFAHGICLCCVTEEELDKDKQYDAFISYSSLDEEFVAKLVAKLEGAPRPYKLCLHDRDWVVGGYIPNQIEESVERSRRTIIVMSQNFLKSKWTRLEFRTAHNATINDARIRVIVILLEDITDIECLDFDLRKYIKMYTYLKCDDSWFWKKLMYALPHPNPKKKRKRKQIDLKSSQNADTKINYSFDRDILF